MLRISRGCSLMCLILGPKGVSTLLAFERKPGCLNVQVLFLIITETIHLLFRPQPL